MSQTEVAIIGAGLAGCYSAYQLQKSGFDVTVVEKSRGLGGRCSRRKLASGHHIDLGASSFTADQATTANLIQDWQQQQLLKPWHFQSAPFSEPDQTMLNMEYCGVPSMNQLHHFLLQTIPVMTNTRVKRLHKTASGWQLEDDLEQRFLQAEIVINTCPAQQTLALYDWTLCDRSRDWHQLIKQQAKQSLPQWVCSIELAQAQPQLADVYRGEHPILAQAIRESSKPGRPNHREVWTLHSTPSWAQQHLSLPPEQAANKLMASFQQTFLLECDATVMTSHRWLLARHTRSQNTTPSLWDRQQKVGICADWLAGNDLQGAILSSQALVKQLLASKPTSTLTSLKTNRATQ